MACEVAVVSTSGGALPEVVGDAGIIEKLSVERRNCYRDILNTLCPLLGGYYYLFYDGFRRNNRKGRKKPHREREN